MPPPHATPEPQQESITTSIAEKLKKETMKSNDILDP